MALFILTCTTLPAVHGYEDEAYFGIIYYQGERTNLTYVWEKGFGLFYRFGHNCSNYSAEMVSPLFLHPPYGVTRGNITAGEAFCSNPGLNPEAPPGKYPITVYLNYTNETRIDVRKEFEFVLEYRQSFEVIDVGLPTTQNNTLSLTLKAYIPLTELKVRFRAYGNIEPETEEFVMTDVEPGVYSFQTPIIKSWLYDDIDMEILETYFDGELVHPQKVSYFITGAIGNRSLSCEETGIEVTVDLDDTNGGPVDGNGGIVDSNGEPLLISTPAQSFVSKYEWPFIALLLVSLAVFDYFYFLRKRK